MADNPNAPETDRADPNETIFGGPHATPPPGAVPQQAIYLPVLVCLSGPDQGRKFTITAQETIVGRDPATAQFAVNDDRISRRHVRILYKNIKTPEKMPVCYLDDLESRNGTFVNGVKASHHHLLHERDRILIGDSVLGFFMRDQEELKFFLKQYRLTMLGNGFPSITLRHPYFVRGITGDRLPAPPESALIVPHRNGPGPNNGHW